MRRTRLSRRQPVGRWWLAVVGLATAVPDRGLLAREQPAGDRCPARSRGRDRAGERRLRRAQLRQGADAGRGSHRPAHGHAGRSRRFDARHHQGDPGRAGAGGRLRGARGRACGKRRHLHSLCLPRRGDGARHQSRGGHAGPDRRRLSEPEPGRAARAGKGARRRRVRCRRAGRGRAAAADRRHGGQDRQRRRGLHPQPRPVAGPQRRMGGAGGAPGGEPARGRGPGEERHRPHRRRPRRPARQARWPHGRAERRRAEPRDRRAHDRDVRARLAHRAARPSSPTRTSPIS